MDTKDHTIKLKFVQGTHVMVTQPINFSHGLPTEKLSDDLAQNLFGLLINVGRFKQKLGLSFSRKFDIELEIDDRKVVLSDIRNGRLITFPVKKVEGSEKVTWEEENEALKETIGQVFKRLVIEIYDVKSMDDEGQLYEVLLQEVSNNEATLFSDYQLYLILKGLKEAKARKLAESYMNNNRNFTKSERMDALSYLDVLLRRYGTDFLLKLITLPERPFGEVTVKRLFENLAKYDGIDVQLAFRNGSKYTFKLINDEVNVFKGSKRIANIKRDGNFESYSDSKEDVNITATLMLYCSQDLHQQLLYYGQETGKCTFCNKPLEDPVSVYWGYGKSCADNHQLPWG